MEEKRPATASIVAALLLLLPCLYIGMYYAMVEPNRLVIGLQAYQLPTYWNPEYRGQQNAAIAKFFYPIHCVDRRVRHSYWAIALPEDTGSNRDVQFTQTPWPVDRLPTVP